MNICARCSRPSKSVRLGCKEEFCPYRFVAFENPVVAMGETNKNLEAIYKKRLEIDDTLSGPDDYEYIMKRVDDFACDNDEPTFDEWRETDNDG